MRLFRIVAPFFVAGVEIDSDGYVRRWAPIIKYMRTWSLERVIEYSHKRGWQIKEVEAL